MKACIVELTVFQSAFIDFRFRFGMPPQCHVLRLHYYKVKPLIAWTG